MECTGNIHSTTAVESIMNTDMLCTDVVGLVGEPFEIETESEFDKATLTFKIDMDKLGEIPFDNLLFLWYNEEDNEFVELETTLDEENGTASIITTHFSKYMIVDKKAWFDAWSIQFNYNPSSDGTHYEPGGTYPTIKFNTALTIDCSGSMSWNDPKNQRADAASKFVEYLHSNDKASVVFFTSSARVFASMTDSKYSLMDSIKKVYSNGGTDFSVAINKAISTFDANDINASNVNNRIILLSDGEDGGTSTALNAALKDCVDKKIKIYTVGFGTANDTLMQRIADITGGKFFKAFSADSLVDIFAKIGYTNDFDMTDTDGDGLPDAVESAGIRLQNGRILQGCDPTNPDTDGDGLLDGEEIDPKPFYSRKEDNGVLGIYKLLGINTVQGYYFKMYSNPIFADSDYDGIDDNTDPRPNNNAFSGKMHYIHDKKEKTCDVKFTVDYRRLFENNELYSEELANLSILFASDTYQDNYIQVTDGIPKGICGGDNGYEFGKLFGLEGEFITVNGDDYEVDNDDVTQFYIGYRPVFYQGEKRIIIVLSVRGTNSTNAEWSSNFDVGADTHDYYDLTGRHPYWKNKLNHKGFDVTMNRVLEKFDNFVSTHHLLNDPSIPKSILITGHSRGGAIANLLGAHFENDEKYKSFTYTFASPYTTTDPKASEYSTIMNIMNTDDLITYLPLSNWGFQKYGRMFTISVEDQYEHKGLDFLADSGTFEGLLGYDYNNDGGTQKTVEDFSKIADNREELYIFDTSADGTLILNDTLYLELSDAEAKLAEFREELEEYKLSGFCSAHIDTYTDNNGEIYPYIAVNYCPAYLMQDLANLTTKDDLKSYPETGYNVKGKYNDAKWSFIWSSGQVKFIGTFLKIGGITDPHMQPTYYLIAHNTLESQYDQ